jgi:ribosome-binding factor A
METTRQKKVARLLQKELGDIFLKDTKHLFGGAFITVTIVRISPDLSFAKVYISLFGSKEPKSLLEIIKSQNSTIRHHLGERVRKQLRIVPALDFHIDDSLDYAEKIDNLLKK